MPRYYHCGDDLTTPKLVETESDDLHEPIAQPATPTKPSFGSFAWQQKHGQNIASRIVLSGHKQAVRSVAGVHWVVDSSDGRDGGRD